MGPALIGFVVRQLGLHYAMLVPAALCARILLLAITMPKSDTNFKG